MADSITIENLSKRFRLTTGHDIGYRTVRDSIAGMFRPKNKVEIEDEKKSIWALRDINLEIGEGEAVGLIGHNGAGKSTLLKILTRITEPTSGRARLWGRVASLLEVGTGFHPELTGRENVFLNGSILGMTRAEIRRDFDQIVAFSQIERFLDVPVKRYSSGMSVRLAFAIAAHLTPEILLVDEVLAVGDIDFQRRCLGRMNEVARSGRTVVFVSHNLASIEALCSRAVLLSRGSVAMVGSTQAVLKHYMEARGGSAAMDVSKLEREGAGRARITSFETISLESSEPIDSLELGQSFMVRIAFEAYEPINDASFGFGFLTKSGERIFVSEMLESGRNVDIEPGIGYVDCRVITPNVLPGVYRFELWISDIPNVRATDHLTSVGEIEVVVGAHEDERAALLTSGARGMIRVETQWSAVATGSSRSQPAREIAHGLGADLTSSTPDPRNR